MTVKTNNHALTEAYAHSAGPHDTIYLPQGSYVSPVDPYYLPRHIKELPEYRHMNHDTHTFAYTKFGLIPLPKKIIKAK